MATSGVVTAFVLPLLVLQSSVGLHSFPGFAVGVVSGEERTKVAKRSVLTFPPSSLLQINMGITVAGELERNTGAVVLAFQQNAALPSESQPLLLPSLVTSARKFSIYQHLRDVLARYGVNGAECLRKMVCQVAETPLGGGLLEDVVTFTLSPSRHRSVQHGDGSTSALVSGLLESERLGRMGGNCSSAFPHCPKTPLDLISAFVSG